ncbi:MAG: hypothetical protein C0594_10945 [Marinilabiliales bacterium]|nr:MAG: hypothetical protein C0594_10945 [Marinilabiliales bacterium]
MNRKVLSISAILLGIILILGSCSKYEEGPAFSLRTKKARLAGDWQIEKMFVDGEEVDLTPDTDSLGFSLGLDVITFTFEKDGSGEISLNVMGFSLDMPYDWEFGDSKETLIITMSSTDGMSLDMGGGDSSMIPDNTEMTILRLTNDELWLEFDQEGTTSEIHFIGV